MAPNPSKDKDMHKGDNPSVLNELIKFYFFLTVKYSSKSEVLSYWFIETLGDLQSTRRGIDPGVKCKIYTIPIFMHQMHISTI
jgi:hypothetical protein